MEQVANKLEAILFAVGRSIGVEEFSNTLEINKEEIEKALNELEKRYSNSTGISLIKVEEEYQLVSNKEYFAEVSKFIENSKKENLSPTCLEVLSIIAYNPKVTKSEIENIRGVNSDSQVGRLLEYGLIEEIGRMKAPGRPAMFSVTKEFLKCMGINKIQDLPDYDTMKTEDDQLSVFKENIEVEEEATV